MPIVDLDDAKDRLDITWDNDDAEIQMFIDAIGAPDGPIENHMNQIIVEREVDEELDLCGRARFWLTNRPVVSLTSLISLDGTITWDVSNFKVRSSGLVRVITGLRPVGCVTATYQAGFATIPANIREGALVILEHLWETQRGAAGIGGGVIGPEEIRRVLSTFTIPNKAIEWLGIQPTMAR